MKIHTDAGADDIISMLLSDSADAQHPAILNLGMRIATGELTHAQARPLLRQALIEIEQQERFWESAFVN